MDHEVYSIHVRQHVQNDVKRLPRILLLHGALTARLLILAQEPQGRQRGAWRQ